MKREWGVRKLVAMALAIVMLMPSFGTAWTARTPLHSAHVDPSLRAGELALVHTTAGLAGALSHTLADLGAVDIRTGSAANMVIARLSDRALAALATDPAVTTATRDIAIVAAGGNANGPVGFEGDTSRDPSMDAIRAPLAWTRTTGQGVAVAILDTGIADHRDLGEGKVTKRVDFVNDGNTAQDPGGHGTFVAGIIAANGDMHGVAPDAELVSLRVLDASGRGTVANVVYAVDWLLKNSRTYRVKVVNLSWGTPQATSYHMDILSALVEGLWFAGMTVVAAAGNDGPTSGTVTTPGSDPFVVTVGSFGRPATGTSADDRESTFSGRGPTVDGFAKPDVLAPGEHVNSLRAAGVRYVNALGNPVGSPTDQYIHMSGTSASVPFVAGVAALVAAAHADFSPTMIKGAIVAGARPVTGSVTPAVDAPAALERTGPANVGLRPSLLLIRVLVLSHALTPADFASRPSGVTWEGVTWQRTGVTWEGITWLGRGVTWEGITWLRRGVTWEGITWTGVTWQTVSWTRVGWETVTWAGITWSQVGRP